MPPFYPTRSALLTALLLTATATSAQLSGSKTIDPTGSGPDNYVSFGAAVAALNTGGVGSGGVTFTVAAGVYDEVIPPLTASGTAAGPIVFMSPGASLTATGTGTTDAAFTLDGADYVRFTGIGVADKATNTTAIQQLEYGFLLQNGASNTIIRNATISLTRGNANKTSGVTQLGGGNNQNQYLGLTVQNCSYGYNLEGGTAATAYDEGTTIGDTPSLFPSIVRNIGPAPGTTGGYAFIVYGIYLKNQLMARIYETDINGVTGSSAVYGIYSTGAQNTVQARICRIHGLNSYATGAGIAIGVNVVSGADHRFDRLQTYDIDSPGTSGFAAGFDITGGTANYLTNNVVYDIRAAASSATTSVRALSFRGGTSYVYHNSMRIGYVATNPANRSGALYMSGSPTVELRNNIFVNQITGLPAGGTGVAAAFYKINTVMTSLSPDTRTNLYHAGTPSAETPIFYGAATSTAPVGIDLTLAQYQVRASPAEAGSVTELPPFVSTTDLHLRPGVPTRVESGGTSLLMARQTVPLDLDGQLRNQTTPDLGADEDAFTPVTATRPAAIVSLHATLVPNPASADTPARLLLTGPAHRLEVHLLDVLGRAVMPVQPLVHAGGESEWLLPTAARRPGLYLLEVREPATGNRLTKRLLVQ